MEIWSNLQQIPLSIYVTITVLELVCHHYHMLQFIVHTFLLLRCLYINHGHLLRAPPIMVGRKPRVSY